MATPKCPYFGRCGGCSAQHIDYSVQLENKRQMLQRAAGRADVEVFSGSEYGYRNRMDFIFHKTGLGFRRRGNWRETIDVTRCEISVPRLNELLTEAREFFFKDGSAPDCFDVIKKTGAFRYALIRTPQDDSAISFVLNADSSRLAEAVERIKEFAAKTTAKNVIVTRVKSDSDVSVGSDYFAVKGSDMLHEEYCGMKLVYPVQGFFQNNHEMAERMIGYSREVLVSALSGVQYHPALAPLSAGAAVNKARPSPGVVPYGEAGPSTNTSKPRTGANANKIKNAELLDLYGGVGAFGIVNADLFKKVTIVESVPECVDAAKKNIASNGLKNSEAELLDAKYLKKLALGKPLYVITDPPRSGMHPDTIAALNRLGPEAIIYVSCNLEQLAKDIPKFKEYSVERAALFDLFPQTPHCEGVVELVRR